MILTRRNHLVLAGEEMTYEELLGYLDECVGFQYKNGNKRITKLHMSHCNIYQGERKRWFDILIHVKDSGAIIMDKFIIKSMYLKHTSVGIRNIKNHLDVVDVNGNIIEAGDIISLDNKRFRGQTFEVKEQKTLYIDRDSPYADMILSKGSSDIIKIEKKKNSTC